MDSLDGIFAKDEDASSKLSYALRTRSSKNPAFLLNTDNLPAIVSQTNLPTPPEQLDNLILFLGDSLPPGQHMGLGDEHIALIGARSLNNLGFIAGAAHNRGLIDGRILSDGQDVYVAINNARLTIDGWAAYLDLKKGKTDSKHAFMAMKFNEPVLDDIYLNHFKEAVKNTGFELTRLDEGQPAGLIDDHLRVRIRKARFIIADLTHHNNGAYWEAGHAEGLGKPVIYTCEKSVFNNKTESTHFDANHHLTVLWEHGRLEEAVKQLKATIRATFPLDAKMEDYTEE
ncbi:hypothetical protein [Nitrosospira lacus]|nr:hypothetical protein [Nitrosospira lacus]